MNINEVCKIVWGKTPLKIVPVSGGSINQTFKILFSDEILFLKVNHTSQYPEMFEKEKNGLLLISRTQCIRVPKPLKIWHYTDGYAYFFMEYIEKGLASAQYYRQLGENLAKMHRQSNKYFGLEEDNYMGAIPQKNNWSKDWVTFFIENRISPLFRQAYNKGYFNSNDAKHLEQLYRNLHNIFPEEKPALIHGDLWSGNAMPESNEIPVIYDPAVYYGHREMDLAMTKLFGGFSAEFYQSYEENFPMEKGFNDRLDIYNLYPLLVHVLLFGHGYAFDVKQILGKF
jgi:fructosamine-3-kinase